MNKNNRKPWYRRLGRQFSPKILLEDLFIRIEDNFPKISTALRYHSHIDVLGPDDFAETILRPNKLFEDAFVQSLNHLCGLIPEFDYERLNKMKIPLHLAFVENAIIHGHIKVPLRSDNGRAFDFEFRNGRYPGRVAWGDVYPLPFYKTTRIVGDVIFVPRLKNVFHLLMENIVPSVCAITRRPDLFKKKITFVTQVNYPALTLLSEHLNSIGFQTDIVVVSAIDRIEVERLICARAFAADSDLNYANAEEMSVIQRFVDNKIRDIQVPEICYIARSHTPRRNVLNQKELVDRLASIGIPSYEFTFNNYLEQIAIFRKAKLIITPHGAALSNLIWSSSGQHILELFSLNRRHKLFLHMASQHDLKYNLLSGSVTSGNDNFNAPIEDVINFVQNYRKTISA